LSVVSNAMKSLPSLENYHEVCELEEFRAHHSIFNEIYIYFDTATETIKMPHTT
jgi:hypothetical protein